MLRKDPFITGEYYHIYNRGIDKRVIFKTKNDFERFIMLLYISNSLNEKSFRLDDLINKNHKSFEEILSIKKEGQLVSIGAWCLMPNHFHILLRQEADGGITKFMKKLGTAYSMFFNIKYQRHGALFGGLFKSKLVGNDDNYMRKLFAYINLNPLDIKFSGWENNLHKFNKNEMKEFVKNYRYSTYSDFLSANRKEYNILNLKNFPNYFEHINSFEDFINNFLN